MPLPCPTSAPILSWPGTTTQSRGHSRKAAPNPPGPHGKASLAHGAAPGVHCAAPGVHCTPARHSTERALPICALDGNPVVQLGPPLLR